MSNIGRAKSCTACRQVKLACDARKKAPGPCTRCSKRDVECRFDPNFKRMSTRKIVQEITSGVRTVHVSDSFPKFDASRSSHISHSPESKCLIGPPSLPTPPCDVSVEREPWLQLKAAEVPSRHRLGNIILDNQSAIELFQHFERYYQPHAHFLQPITTSLERYEKSSRLLFWTIILCSSQMHSKYADLYAAISAEHEILLSDIVHAAIHSMGVLHALLCLCLWPVPKLRHQSDPSWNYIGLAINAAMHLNCHLRSHEGSPLADWKGFGGFTMRDIDTDTKNLTWLYCFDIGIRVGEFMGFPSPLSSPYHLKSITGAQEESAARIPLEYRAVLEIRRIASIATMQLESVDDTAAHFSLIQMFIGNLETVKTTYLQHWTPDVEVNFQGAKLYLYAMTFTLSPPQDPIEASQSRTYRQIILRQGLLVASSLISSMTELSRRSTTQKDEAGVISTVAFYPKLYFTNLFFASVFLFRVLLSYHMPTQEDTSLAISCLADAHKIFQSVPNHRDHTRAAITIETMVTIIRDGSKVDAFPTSEPIITNRLGASMMFDTTLRCAQHRNRHPVTGRTVPVASWKTMDDGDRWRLPSAPEERVTVPKPRPRPVTTGREEEPMPWWATWDTYMSDFGVGCEDSNVYSSDDTAVWNGQMTSDLFGYEFGLGSANWTGSTGISPF